MTDFKYKFSGHQTFVFRYGWLEKGVQLIQKNPHGFNDDDCLITLGVGKNMVESIKYWCMQTDLLRPDVGGNMSLTDLGKLIFGEKDFSQGVDPYLEDDATLWLLHWSLMWQTQKEEPTWSTWQYAFYKWHKPEFIKSDLLQSLSNWCKLQKQKVTDASLERDIDCFARNYAGTRSKAKDGEESFDSPFLALELLQNTSQPELYRFNIGAKKNLPAEIVGYVLLKFLKGRKNINVQGCLYDEASPGQIFKLNENAFMEYLPQLEKITDKKLQQSETAGLVSIAYTGKTDSDEYAKELLNQYYGRAN